MGKPDRKAGAQSSTSKVLKNHDRSIASSETFDIFGKDIGAFDLMNKSKLGMTFVEVIIAMAIFAILVVAIFPAFLIGVKLNSVSKDSVETASVSQSIMEELYVYSLNNNFADTGSLLTTALYTKQGPISNSTTFTKITADYTIVIVLTENTPAINMTKAKVTVSKNTNPYNNKPGQAETILLFKKP